MVLFGVFSLSVGYYLRFVLLWRGAGAFSVVNVLLGFFIVIRGFQYIRGQPRIY
jgi:hypothetical protein